ncbi:hypothetical protein [Nocardia mexicana]|uniref:Uncharacterized protein n=1 Tax=Nocardia mexicana TaxID=279262 RepID=A0A370HHE2_9NOCA|nr:hypothetical protein [Nocardia mexicana]RDI54594.1 hypothetical protein DFR68_102722 [Nocardia mexicana]
MKVGDRVKLTKNHDIAPLAAIAAGTVGEIVGVRDETWQRIPTRLYTVQFDILQVTIAEMRNELAPA